MGSILGRGNQQISPEVIRRVGKKNIIIISTVTKLAQTGVLSVDTGDPDLDAELSGFMRVIVSRHETKLAKVTFQGSTSADPPLAPTFTCAKAKATSRLSGDLTP